MADKITLEYLIEQAMKIPGVKVDRAEYLSTTFADQGILVPQIVEEGPVASDYSEIELDNLAEKLILRRTSESSAMSFAAGIPGGHAAVFRHVASDGAGACIFVRREGFLVL